MSDDRYRQIFESFGRDLLAVAEKHGKRALQEAVRDAINGNLLQEEDGIPPEDLEYPDEDVWTLPPAPEDEDEETGEDESDDDELSEAAERVASELAEKLERRLRK